MLRRPLIAAIGALLAFTPGARADPTWLSPVPLSTAAAGAGGAVDVSVGGDGTAIAVWIHDGGVQAAVRAPGGRWGAPRQLSADAAAASPMVRLDAGGDALVVWTETGAGGTVVRGLTRPAGGDFSAATDISVPGTAASPRTASQVALAMDDGGAAAVTWVLGTSPDATVQAVIRDGPRDRFGVPERLSTAGSASQPHVGMDVHGNAIVVWIGGAVMEATRPAAGAWRDAQSVPGSLSGGLDVALAGDTALIAWGSSTMPSTNNFAVSYETLRPATGVVTGTGTSGATYNGRFVATFDDDGTAVLFEGEYTYGSGALSLAVGTPGGEFLQTPFEPAGGFPGLVFGLARGFHGGTLAFWHFRDGGWSAAVRPTGDFLGVPQTVATAAVTGGPSVAGDRAGDAVGAWEQQDADGYRVYAADYDGAPPELSRVSIPDTVTVGDRVTMGATAADAVTGASVTWDFGDGHGADGADVTHVYAHAGARSVVVTATDAVGNAASVTRQLTVVTPPAPPLPVVLDDDHDGVSPPTDCDDHDPHIGPTAPEIPGNAVDENCDGKADPYPSVTASAALTAQALGHGRTRLLKLVVRDLAGGDTVKLACTGKGCTKSMRRTVAIKKATKTLDLTRFVKAAKLHAGTRLSVTVAHTGSIARTFTYVMRANAPRVEHTCQAPGAEPVKC